MLEDLIGAVVRSQVGSLKRRTTGAILEGVALGLVGLAAVFLSVGLYALLSQHMAAWQAALIVAAVVLVFAAAAFLAGRAMLQRNELRQREQIHAGLESLGLLSRPTKIQTGQTKDDERRHRAPVLVAAAIAAGVILGRSIKR